MNGFRLILSKLGGKFAGRMVSKTVLKRLLLGSFTNIFTSVLIWVIEFFLHPFLKKWRSDLLKKVGWDEKKKSEETAIVKKET